MAVYSVYTSIDAENDTAAIDWARGYCFEEEPTESNIGYGRYVDTVNGIDVYYDYGADYYFFTPSEED